MPMTTREQAFPLAVEPTRALTARTIWTLVGGFLLLEAALWTPRPYQTILSFFTLTYVIVAVIRRGHTAADVGLSLRTLSRGWWTIVIALALGGAMLLLAWTFDTLHVITRGRAMFAGPLLYFVWALQQEFMLQAFFFLALKRLVGQRSAILMSAGIFALAHLPNPILTIATLLGGILFTLVFARYRNLVVVAVLHALLGITLAISAPDSINRHMRVGLGYLKYNVGIAPVHPPIPLEPRHASFVEGDQLR